MLFDDFFRDRKSQSAASLGGIAGRVCPVETLKYQRKLFFGDSLTVVLDLHPDELLLLGQSEGNLQVAVRRGIFDRIADDIADDALELLGIGYDDDIRIHIVKESEIHALLAQIQTEFLGAVLEIITRIELDKGIGNGVAVQFGIEE